MKNLICFLFLLTFYPSIGQTFRECSTNYADKYKKIEFDRMRYKITQKASDSLRAILDAEFYGCILGKTMGDYSLVGRSGNIYTPENLQGKVVLFNFWIVGCGPCIVEVPMLNRLATLYKENDDFALISVLLNDQAELDKLLQRGLIRGSIKYEVITNDKLSIKENFGFVKAFPTNLFLDKEGKIYMRTIGSIQDQESLEKIRSIIDSELTK